MRLQLRAQLRLLVELAEHRRRLARVPPAAGDAEASALSQDSRPDEIDNVELRGALAGDALALVKLVPLLLGEKFLVLPRPLDAQNLLFPLARVRAGAREVANLLCLPLGAVVLIRPGESSNIPSLFAVEVLHSPQRVCAKEDANWNISFMLVTLDTSHLEMSQLNDIAEANMPFIFVTLETSHLERSPLNDDAE